MSIFEPAPTPPEFLAWRSGIVRQAAILREMPSPLLRDLWDRYDGCNAPEGWEGEAIHLALNQVGDGDYCAV